MRKTAERIELHRKVLSEIFARRLAGQTHGNVCVTCGIHCDNPGQDGLDQIVAAAQRHRTLQPEGGSQ